MNWEGRELSGLRSTGGNSLRGRMGPASAPRKFFPEPPEPLCMCRGVKRPEIEGTTSPPLPTWSEGTIPPCTPAGTDSGGIEGVVISFYL